MPTFTYRGIDFLEAAGYRSPEEAWGDANSRMTVEYLVNWSDRRAARLALLGTTTSGTFMVGTSSYVYLKRQNPHQYPSGEPLYCIACPKIIPEATPLGKDANSIIRYSDARLTAIYSYLPWDILEDNQVQGLGGQPDESLLLRNIVAVPTESARQLTYRGGTWRWLDTTNPKDAGKPYVAEIAVGVPLLTTDWDYLWTQIPYRLVPKAAILAAVGSVNAATWDGMAPGTFLVKPPAWELTRMPDGQRAVNVHVRGVHNARGWNNYPDPRRGNAFFPLGAQTVAGGPVTARPYPSTDMAPLFRPASP